MDLLGNLGEETRDAEGACRTGTHATHRRHASTLLLAWLPASLGSDWPKFVTRLHSGAAPEQYSETAQ